MRRRIRSNSEALRKKLKREALLRALDKTAGIISADSHPEWETSEKAADWVRMIRREGDRKFL